MITYLSKPKHWREPSCNEVKVEQNFKKRKKKQQRKEARSEPIDRCQMTALKLTAAKRYNSNSLYTHIYHYDWKSGHTATSSFPLGAWMNLQTRDSQFLGYQKSTLVIGSQRDDANKIREPERIHSRMSWVHPESVYWCHWRTIYLLLVYLS